MIVLHVFEFLNTLQKCKCLKLAVVSNMEFAFLICVIFSRGLGTSNFENDLYFKFNLLGVLIAPLIMKLVHYLQFEAFFSCMLNYFN